MKSIQLLVFMCVAVMFIWLAPANGAEEKAMENSEKAEKNPIVEMKTSEGTIKIELWADKAPVTVKNFLQYAEEGFYEGTIFHRVIDGFMIQGGGFTPDMRQKQPRAPIKNEAKADLKNDLGTIAMARTMVVDSATSQFFINVKNNESLNHRDESPQGFGYAVFGKVIEGMDVVDKIKALPTGNAGPHQNVPRTPIIIEKVTVLK
jgi:cyclophilin family peptidyl-prolyl cis-trans isomerase